jgi:hypothetical protein
MGFTLQFYVKENWDNKEYRKGIKMFLAFHFFFILFLISFIRTLFHNPGYYNTEYHHLYSITKFIKHLFIYLTKGKDLEFNFTEFLTNSNNSPINEDIREIVEIQKNLSERMNDISHCLSGYSSIEVTTRRGIYYEIQNMNNMNNEKAFVNSIDEDSVNSFENEYENFIKSNFDYNKMNNLTFYERSEEGTRFCGHCLIKKVILK